MRRNEYGELVIPWGKVMGIISIILAVFILAMCSSTYVPPGHNGVKVYKFGSDKGVADKPIEPGIHIVGPHVSVYKYPTFQQNELWSKSVHEGKTIHDESITFQCEAMDMNADVGVIYRVIPDLTPKLFQQFRLGLDEISEGYLKQRIRSFMNDYATEYKIERLYGEDRKKFLAQVLTAIRKEVEPYGIQILEITVAGLRPPPSVTAAVDAKIAATQKAIQVENELREEKAKAAKKIAEAEGEAQSILTRAKGQAEANSRIAASITPTLVEYERIKKWDGKLPQVQGGATPFVNLPAPAK